MTTLIYESSPGNPERRCDAKCHDATHPECDCICEGKYHGVTNRPREEWPIEIKQLYPDQPALL